MKRANAGQLLLQQLKSRMFVECGSVNRMLSQSNALLHVKIAVIWSIPELHTIPFFMLFSFCGPNKGLDEVPVPFMMRRVCHGIVSDRKTDKFDVVTPLLL